MYIYSKTYHFRADFLRVLLAKIFVHIVSLHDPHFIATFYFLFLQIQNPIRNFSRLMASGTVHDRRIFIQNLDFLENTKKELARTFILLFILFSAPSLNLLFLDCTELYLG